MSLTGTQIRTARAALGWSVQRTADKIGVSRKTIERLEMMRGVPSARAITLSALRRLFEEAGIVFVERAFKVVGIEWTENVSLQDVSLAPRAPAGMSLDDARAS